MYNLLQPQRLSTGFLDLKWWNTLSIEERFKYEVWHEEIKYHPDNQINKENKLHIVIDPEILDLSKLDEDKENRKFNFRPTKWDEMIGQNQAKQRVQYYIDGCKKFNEIFPHTFLSAPAGHGKTIFANIMANTLNQKFVKLSGGDIKTEQIFLDKLAECNGGVLFIDEAHRLNTKIGTFMLTILEEYIVLGKRIKPFTCILASTHKGNLSEKLSALIQRFLPIELIHYNIEDLILILKQYHKNSYPNINISNDIFKIIAENCKFTPRIALAYLKEYVYTENWEKVKINNDIVKEGITNLDVQALQYLKMTGGAGKNSIAKSLKIEPKTYEYEMEPFLIFKQFITVDNKRKLSNIGQDFLKSIN